LPTLLWRVRCEGIGNGWVTGCDMVVLPLIVSLPDRGRRGQREGRQYIASITGVLEGGLMSESRPTPRVGAGYSPELA
jgi:hypothetical protein